MGYVMLHPFEEDKRQHVVNLTDMGRSDHDRLEPVLDARQQHLVATLGDVEQAVTRKAIKAIAAAAGKTDFDVHDPYAIGN